MKKILSFILVLSLMMALSMPVYAVTPGLNIPNVSIPDFSDNIKIELSDDFWNRRFDEHPLPEITVKLEVPVISSAKYVHKTLYYGMSKHLKIYWNTVENADSYEVLITKADGTTFTYEVTNNCIYDKKVECPKVYIENTHTWTAATVQVRAKAGDLTGDWSEAVKISCDKLH